MDKIDTTKATQTKTGAGRSARLLTYLLFFLFAITTDAVGVIIPEVIAEFDLTLTQASGFHYVTMLAIALSGLGLGFLSDRYGRKRTILLGMGLFSAATLGFVASTQYALFMALTFSMGLAIGIFKTGALALVGDVSSNPHDHTRTMNLAEGFFGVGAIAGPAIVTYMISQDVHWTWLYGITGVSCLFILLFVLRQTFPDYTPARESNAGLQSTLKKLKDPYVLGFSTAIALYVVTEAAIYVWMPTYLLGYDGQFELVAAYALTTFFIFRAAGRFIGAWILHTLPWKLVLTVFSGGIALCYTGAVVLGVNAAAWILPVSGIFMSVMYPTINSKGISCFAPSEHGAVAGIILFFTAVAAAGGPLVMALLGDAFGNVAYGFYFTLACAVLLFILAILNQLFDPAGERVD